jgi:DNA-binding NarL/FixJ family response regulator
VLDLAARGMGDKQIALYLGISARTVGDRFAEMRESAGASSKGELRLGVAAGHRSARPAAILPAS